MRFLLLLSCLFIATCAMAQSDYSVICTEAGAKLITPTDSVGVVLDSTQLASDIAELDIQIENIAIQEAELTLLKRKRELTTRRNFFTSVEAQRAAVCIE